MSDFITLAQDCAPFVSPQTMTALVRVESDFNPYAIGIVGGRLVRQPQNSAEAIATAKSLDSEGWNFSVGLTQINKYNLPKHDISYAEAFDSCTNLKVGSKILGDCFTRASKKIGDEQQALQAAFSCYYSGNFNRGFRPDHIGQPSYVDKILAEAKIESDSIQIVPEIKSDAKPLPVYPHKQIKPQFPLSSKILSKPEKGNDVLSTPSITHNNEIDSPPTQSSIVF